MAFRFFQGLPENGKRIYTACVFIFLFGLLFWNFGEMVDTIFGKASASSEGNDGGAAEIIYALYFGYLVAFILLTRMFLKWLRELRSK